MTQTKVTAGIRIALLAVPVVRTHPIRQLCGVP
jgi:hypothetical protein